MERLSLVSRWSSDSGSDPMKGHFQCCPDRRDEYRTARTKTNLLNLARSRLQFFMTELVWKNGISRGLCWGVFLGKSLLNSGGLRLRNRGQGIDLLKGESDWILHYTIMFSSAWGIVLCIQCLSAVYQLFTYIAAFAYVNSLRGFAKHRRILTVLLKCSLGSWINVVL